MAEPRGTTARLVLVAAGVVVLLYLPLALSYMWFAFHSGAPRLQDALNAAVNGASYSRGEWSVPAVRERLYEDHRLLMTTHTTLAAIALMLAFVQLVPRLQGRRVLHRWVGRCYLALMTVSMTAALAFLALAPTAPYPGQRAFDLQLWVLAASTLATGWLGFLAARRGDLTGHRAAMGLTFSFMMTAPLLRLLWILLGPVFPDHVMLTNLQVGSVLLAVVAPGAGGLAFVTSQTERLAADRPGHRAARRGTLRKDGTVTDLLLTLVAVAGLMLVWMTYDVVTGGTGPAAYPAFHIVPVVLYVVVGMVGAARARNCEDLVGERRWRLLLAGAAAAPWAALVVAAVAAVVYGPFEGYLAGLMVGPGGPILVSVGCMVRHARRSEREGLTAPALSHRLYGAAGRPSG